MALVEYKGSTVPVFALTDNMWDEVICKKLIPRILVLLSVNVDKIDPKKIAATELMIRESAYRNTPSEIEKAFLMYVKGELNGLEVIEGNISPILFNKVMNQYRSQKTVKPKEIPPPVISDEEKLRNSALNVIYAYEDWVQDKNLNVSYFFVFETLKEFGLLTVSEEESKAMNKFLNETYPAMEREKKRRKGMTLLVEKYFSSLEKHVRHEVEKYL